MKTSVKIARFLLLIAFLALTSASGYDSGRISYRDQPQGYVLVCHGGHNLRVTASSLDYHLRHGDRLGGCLADPT